MLLGRPLSANLPPLQHQLDVDQEEQQHEHPLRGDGDVADERGDGQLQVHRVVKSEEKEEIGGKRESKQIRICQSMNIFEVSHWPRQISVTQKSSIQIYIWVPDSGS